MTDAPLPVQPDELPSRLPIFPLAGCILLPGGQLPLNIFEPRYLDMCREAMAGEQIIGMVQPIDPNDTAENPSVYATGCAGRIIEFEEADDNRFLITLRGLCRFEIAEELSMHHRYREVCAAWTPFAQDLKSCRCTLDRDDLIPRLETYFNRCGLKVDWEVIAETPDHCLVTSLAMICPFMPTEKQALLECPDTAARSDLLVTLMEMATASNGEAPVTRH
jgi:Lon protease-like protein